MSPEFEPDEISLEELLKELGEFNDDEESDSPQQPRLREVGFWRSKDGKDYKEFPIAQDCVDKNWNKDEKALVVRYLQIRHREEGCYKGSSQCRICEGHKSNGSSEYSDDIWIWPEGYLHYITEHNVKPPQEFIDHCINNFEKEKTHYDGYLAMIEAIADTKAQRQTKYANSK